MRGGAFERLAEQRGRLSQTWTRAQRLGAARAILGPETTGTFSSNSVRMGVTLALAPAEPGVEAPLGETSTVGVLGSSLDDSELAAAVAGSGEVVAEGLIPAELWGRDEPGDPTGENKRDGGMHCAAC